MNNFVRVYIFLMTLLIGAWIATQKLAEMLAYNPRALVFKTYNV